MNSLILSILCIFVLIPIINGINCVSCVGWQNSGCNDPYDETSSGDLPVPGNTYCLKVVYPSYIERMAGGRACTPGSGPGGSTKYCCSNQDYCNETTRHNTPTFGIIFLIITLLAAKFKYIY